jgi:hypothetical protein
MRVSLFPGSHRPPPLPPTLTPHHFVGEGNRLAPINPLPARAASGGEGTGGQGLGGLTRGPLFSRPFLRRPPPARNTKARSPQVRPHSSTARPSDLRRRPLVTRASRFLARSPWSAPPHIHFLSIGPQFRSSFLPTVGRPTAVALHFARRDQLTMGLAPTRMRPCCAHKRKAAPRGGLRCLSLRLALSGQRPFQSRVGGRRAAARSRPPRPLRPPCCAARESARRDASRPRGYARSSSPCRPG